MLKEPCFLLYERAIKDFEGIQVQYAGCGAHDSEPDGIFQDLVVKALDDVEYTIPKTIAGWQLYVLDLTASQEAAQALHDATAEILDLIKKSDKSNRIIQYLLDYCWRIE